MTAILRLKHNDQDAWNSYLWEQKEEQRQETTKWLAGLVGQDIAKSFAEVLAFAYINDHESADLIAIRFDMDKKEFYAFLDDDELFEQELEKEIERNDIYRYMD